MDPAKAMEEGKKANREMIELFRSLPDDCYSIELMEKIVSMPMWCVGNIHRGCPTHGSVVCDGYGNRSAWFACGVEEDE